MRTPCIAATNVFFSLARWRAVSKWHSAFFATRNVSQIPHQNRPGQFGSAGRPGPFFDRGGGVFFALPLSPESSPGLKPSKGAAAGCLKDLSSEALASLGGVAAGGAAAGGAAAGGAAAGGAAAGGAGGAAAGGAAAGGAAASLAVNPGKAAAGGAAAGGAAAGLAVNPGEAAAGGALARFLLCFFEATCVFMREAGYPCRQTMHQLRPWSGFS